MWSTFTKLPLYTDVLSNKKCCRDNHPVFSCKTLNLTQTFHYIFAAKGILQDSSLSTCFNNFSKFNICQWPLAKENSVPTPSHLIMLVLLFWTTIFCGSAHDGVVFGVGSVFQTFFPRMHRDKHSNSIHSSWGSWSSATSVFQFFVWGPCLAMLGLILFHCLGEHAEELHIKFRSWRRQGK